MVATQILIIATFLSVTWGIYLLGTIHMYHQAQLGIPPTRAKDRRRQDIVVAMRRFIVAFCLWLFVFSFLFRTLCVLIGVGDDISGQIVFFALLGSNVGGSIYCVISLWFD